MTGLPRLKVHLFLQGPSAAAHFFEALETASTPGPQFQSLSRDTTPSYGSNETSPL